MAIRRRTWLNPDGSKGEAWVVDYRDQRRKRHIKAFKRRKDADVYHATVKLELRRGIHTADSSSINVTEAGQLWLKSGEAAGLERSTLDGYRQHLDFHLGPLIGAVKLSQLSAPSIRQFEDELRATRSPAMVRKVMSSLGSLLADAQERGHVAQNVVHALRSRRRRGKERQTAKRQRGKLKIGVDIPAPAKSAPSSPISRDVGGRSC